MPVSWSDRGYKRVETKLTVKALEILKEKYPALPEIDTRIAAAKEADLEAARIKEEEDQAREAKRVERALANQQIRRESMAQILEDYQIQHTLTGDQLVDIWCRVVNEEMKI